MSTDKIKWDKSIEKFILDKMIINKLLPATIFNKYPDQLPSQRTYERRRADDQDFSNKINMAYGVIFDHYHGQLEELSSMSPVEAYIHYGKAKSPEDVDFKDANSWWQGRIRVLTTNVTTVSGILSKKYDKKQQVEVKGEVDNKHIFVFPDYVKLAADQALISSSKDITPIDDDNIV